MNPRRPGLEGRLSGAVVAGRVGRNRSVGGASGEWVHRDDGADDRHGQHVAG